MRSIWIHWYAVDLYTAGNAANVFLYPVPVLILDFLALPVQHVDRQSVI
jgi:hypothetical protein